MAAAKNPDDEDEDVAEEFDAGLAVDSSGAFEDLNDYEVLSCVEHLTSSR